MMLRVMCQKFCATRSGPTYSNFCSGKSFDVTIAFTPGRVAAFEVSIERMRAWAWGERRIRPVSMPGMTMSEPYCAVPVTFGTPSGRIGRVPTHLKPFVSGAATSFTAISSCLEHVWVKRRARFAEMQAVREASRQSRPRLPRNPPGTLLSESSKNPNRRLGSIAQSGRLSHAKTVGLYCACGLAHAGCRAGADLREEKLHIQRMDQRPIFRSCDAHRSRQDDISRRRRLRG